VHGSIAHEDPPAATALRADRSGQPAPNEGSRLPAVVSGVVCLALAAALSASTAVAVGPLAAAKGGSLTWPGTTAPCNTTLQACIDGAAAGSEVMVNTALPIDESISVNRSLRLLAARNVSARLAAGRGITGNVNGSEPWLLTLRGFRLTDASVRLSYSGSASATIEVANLQLESSGSASPAGINISTLNGSGHSVRVRENRLRVAAPSLFDSAIDIEFRGGAGTHVGEVFWNEITSRGASQGWGILASAVGATTAEFRIQGNTVRGQFQRAGIMVSEGLFSESASTVTARVLSNVVIGDGGFSGGIDSVVKQGSTNAQIINNTVVRASGIGLSSWGGDGPPATGTTSGLIANNLIVSNRRGMQNVAPSGTATNNYNLLRNNVSAGAYTPGANDINADPLLRSLDAPRLGPGSPAIDAGNSLALIGGGTLPLVDGDGLRRLVSGDGGPAAVDIGAYEYGHRMLLAPSSLAAFNYFPIDDALINAGNGTRVFTALNRFINPFVTNPRPTGVFFNGVVWNVFNQDQSVISSTLAYNVFHPLPSSDSTMHTVTATMPGFPNASVLPSPDAGHIVFAEQNWNGSGASSVYNNNPIAVGRSGSEFFVHNANGAALPTGAKFNVYSQPPTPNVFRVQRQAGDPLTNEALLLNHPLLDGNPCARFVAVLENSSPSADAAGATFDLIYSTSDSRWRIFSMSGSIVGKSYNVLVVPEQVSDCTKGPLFRDQFES
jgi:hypothetical protein